MLHKAKVKPAEGKRDRVAIPQPLPPLATQHSDEKWRSEIAQLRYAINCVVEHLDSKFSPGVFTDEERKQMGIPRAV